MRVGFAARLVSTALLASGAGAIWAQTTTTSPGVYPNKPIRIVASAPGGSSDFAARLIARGLSDAFGQQVIVDNRSTGVIPGNIVAKAPPDGYTLLVFGSPLWIGPLMQKTPYDPVKDFAPVTMAVRAPNILVVTPSIAANSVKELITLAKSKPGTLNYASVTSGSSTHLAAELFNSMADVKIVRINYKGGGPATTDLISGQVQMMFATASSVAPHIKSGRLRALAVTSAQPSALLPGLPTVAATLPGFETVSPQSVFAPARTPDAVIKRLNQEIVRSINTPEIKEKFFGAGTEIVGNTPEQFAALIKAEMTRMGKVIKDADIRAE